MASTGMIVAPSVNGLGILITGRDIKPVRVNTPFDQPNRFIGTHAVGALRPGSAAGLQHDAGAQAKQVLVVAAIQGKIDDVRVLKGAALRGIRGLHQRNGFSDRNRLVLFARLNGQVDSNFMANLDDDALTLDPLKSFGLGADRVVARSQVRSVVCARIIRGEGSSECPSPCR